MHVVVDVVDVEPVVIDVYVDDPADRDLPLLTSVQRRLVKTGWSMTGSKKIILFFNKL